MLLKIIKAQSSNINLHYATFENIFIAYISFNTQKFSNIKKQDQDSLAFNDL
ncbi:hypothetical protein Bbu156a_R41 (plasmid) [Borreliella burgdorferi 156a]|nr:hypothetical protein Bbu156a_R41 [Borreliella burgdorferi 156a]